ncbi:MAG: AMP-binding protein [Clostridia bacterium]|nr:AMP-binding protein [Clostridia bacterium]
MSIIHYETRHVNNFKELLESSARLFPARPAFKIREKDGSISEMKYPKLLNIVNALGTALCSLGLKAKNIAVMGKNSHKWCIAYFGITNGTGVVVPVDKELMAEDVLNILTVSDSKAMFVDDKSYEKLQEIKDRLPQDFTFIGLDEIEGIKNVDELIKLGEELLEKGDRTFLDAEVDSDGLGSLLFTSGTTGMAKGVMLSQRNIVEDIIAVKKVVKITPDDTILSVLPLHHTYESSLCFVQLMYTGGCYCFCEGLRYITRDMQDYQPTIFVTVPLMLEKMHAKILKKVHEKKVGKFALTLGKMVQDGFVSNLMEKIFAEVKKTFGGKLRLIIVGAAALNPEVAKDFKTFGIPTYIGYGLTECAPLVIGNNDHLMLPDSVGVPLPGVEAKIYDPDDNGVGEIWVKGPMVMKGYYKDEAATKAVLTEDGWFKTGDMGTVDEQGCYRIVGRCKNVIVTKNGKNIYPEEVEYHLNNHPFVSECIVFGADCDEAEEGTQVVAKIFPDIQAITAKLKDKQAPSKEELQQIIGDVIKEVNKKLPKYKNIRDFDIRDIEFVKTTTAKIKRQANLEEENKTTEAVETTEATTQE